MNNKLPKELQERQERTRQETINRVLHAINDLKAEGYQVKIKDIIEYTGLSRSVLSKEHLRKVLIQQGIVEEKSDGKLNHLSDDSKDNHLKAEVRRKEEQNRKLKAENLELREECELLRGRLYLLMQRQSLED